MEEIKKEKFLEKSTNPIFLDGLEIITNQMKKCVCKILLNDGQQNTGFFCKIPYPDNSHLLPSLVTCNFIIGKEMLAEGSIIHISLENDKEMKEIKITNARKIYTNDKYCITFIELIPEDKIDDFLEIDPIVFKDDGDLKNIYKKSSAYVLHYLKGDKVAYSSGIISELDDYNICHLCNTEIGSSGGPILSSNSFQVIGIHVGTSKNKEFNKGVLIRSAIVQFIQSNIGQ